MRMRKIKAVFGATLTSLVFVAGCGDSSPAGLVEANRIEIMTSAASAYIPSCSQAANATYNWAATSFTGCEDIEILDREVEISNEPTVLVQVVETPGFLPMVMATSDIIFDSNDPTLYALGEDSATGEGEIWMYDRNWGSEPIDETNPVVVQLPAGEIGVALEHRDSGLWWVATTDASGDIGVYKFRDEDSDRRPETFHLFAKFSAFSENSGSVLARLDADPFVLVQISSDEVAVFQEHSARLRLIDYDQDGSADSVLYPFLGDRPGPTVTRGWRPGAKRIEVMGQMGDTIEVWTVDGRGLPVAQVSDAVDLDEEGRALVDLYAPLQDGDILSILDVDIQRLGEPVVVETFDGPMAMRTTTDEVRVGESIDFFVEFPPTTVRSGPFAQPALTATWTYMNKNDWGTYKTVTCGIQDLGRSSYRVSFPVGIDNQSRSHQYVTFTRSDLAKEDIVDVTVLPLLPAEAAPDGGGDGG